MQSFNRYTRHSLLEFLAQHQIPYQLVEHPPVATCADVAALATPIPGADTKHLFIRNRSGQFFLLMTRADKRIDLNGLKHVTGSRVQFANADELQVNLGILPGSVSLLAAINDPHGRVRVVADLSLAEAEDLQQHPLENVATLLLSQKSFRNFFAVIGRELEWLELPGRV